MSRKALVPISLPGNPTQVLEAVPKQYADALRNYNFIQDTTPVAASVGQTWWKSDDGNSFVAIDRGGGVLVWVQFAGPFTTGMQGPQGPVGPTVAMAAGGILSGTLTGTLSAKPLVGTYNSDPTAVSINAATGMFTFLQAGWYRVGCSCSWGGSANAANYVQGQGYHNSTIVVEVISNFANPWCTTTGYVPINVVAGQTFQFVWASTLVPVPVLRWGQVIVERIS